MPGHRKSAIAAAAILIIAHLVLPELPSPWRPVPIPDAESPEAQRDTTEQAPDRAFREIEDRLQREASFVDGVVYGDGKSATPPFPQNFGPRGRGRAR